MPQRQYPVFVIPLEGQPRDAIATGNNAAWRCECKRELPLVGCTGALSGETEKTRIECPTCQRNYFVVPTNKNRGSVREVREIKPHSQAEKRL